MLAVYHYEKLQIQMDQETNVTVWRVTKGEWEETLLCRTTLRKKNWLCDDGHLKQTAIRVICVRPQNTASYANFHVNFAFFCVTSIACRKKWVTMKRRLKSTQAEKFLFCMSEHSKKSGQHSVFILKNKYFYRTFNRGFRFLVHIHTNSNFKLNIFPSHLTKSASNGQVILCCWANVLNGYVFMYSRLNDSKWQQCE